MNSNFCNKCYRKKNGTHGNLKYQINNCRLNKKSILSITNKVKEKYQYITNIDILNELNDTHYLINNINTIISEYIEPYAVINEKLKEKILFFLDKECTNRQFRGLTVYINNMYGYIISKFFKNQRRTLDMYRIFIYNNKYKYPDDNNECVLNFIKAEKMFNNNTIKSDICINLFKNIIKIITDHTKKNIPDFHNQLNNIINNIIYNIINNINFNLI